MAEDRLEQTNIILTGFMGTGKTTIGRLLAAELDYEFIDTDALITERHGPIPQIFASEGEEVFRALERELARELAGRDKVVIATGGGMLVDKENARLLAERGRIFCLTAAPQTILERVSAAAGERPLLDGPDPERRITDLLNRREAAYQLFTQVPTDGRFPNEIVDLIINLLDTTA